jgi:hypothetical protein
MAKRFVGWRRVGRGRWHPVAEADDAGECWARLLGHAADTGGSGESVVLVAGRSPTEAPAVQETGR